MDDSKSSSDESCENSKQQAVNDDEGTGRSYECVFCKRGFTTAQALGGHMNIHRKDRAKVSRQPSTATTTVPISNQSVECIRPEAGFINQLHQSTIISTHQQAAEAQVNCQMYFPPTSSPSIDHYNHPHQPLYYGIEERDLMSRSFDQDWCRPSLSLKIGPSSHDIEDNDDNNQPGQDGEEECQVDLELRLGPDP